MSFITFTRPKIVLEPDWFIRDSSTPTSATGDVIRRGGYILQSIRRELTREEKRQQVPEDSSASTYQDSPSDLDSPLSDMDENPGIEQASGVLLIRGIQHTDGEKATLQVEILGTVTIWLKEAANAPTSYVKANSVSSLSSLAQTFSFARLDSLPLLGANSSNSAGSGLSNMASGNGLPSASSNNSIGGNNGLAAGKDNNEAAAALYNATATVGGAAFRSRKKSSQRGDAVSIQIVRESTMMRVRMEDIRDQESAVSFCMPLEESRMPISFTSKESQMNYILRATLSVDGNLITMQETPLIISYAPPAVADSPGSLMVMSTSSHTASPLSAMSARRNSADVHSNHGGSLPRPNRSQQSSISSQGSAIPSNFTMQDHQVVRGSAMSLQDPPISPIMESPRDSVSNSSSSISGGTNGTYPLSNLVPSGSMSDMKGSHRGSFGSLNLHRENSAVFNGAGSRRGTNPSLSRDRLPRSASNHKIISSCWHKGVSGPLEFFTYRVTCPELVPYDSTSLQVILELQVKEGEKVSYIESSSAQLIEHRVYTLPKGVSNLSEVQNPVHVKCHIHKPVTYPVNKGVPYSVVKAQESKESGMFKKFNIPTLAVGEMVIMTLNIPFKQGALIPDVDLKHLRVYHDISVDIVGQDYKGNARKETITFPVRVGNPISSIALFNPSAFK